MTLKRTNIKARFSHLSLILFLVFILFDLSVYSSTTLSENTFQRSIQPERVPLTWNEPLGPALAPSPPVVGDLDNDGTLEVLVGTGYFIYFFSSNGSYFGNWGGKLYYANYSTDRLLSPTILYKENRTEVLVQTYDLQTKGGRIIAFNPLEPTDEYWSHTIQGGNRAITLYYPISGEDGRIFIGSYTGMVYCWDFDGVPCTGWPRNFSTWIPTVMISPQPAQSEPEVIIGAKNGTLWVTDFSANILASWPQSVDAEITGLATADLDYDGTYEIVVATQTGWLYVFQHDGTIKNGWPQHFTTDVYDEYQPVLADLDKDGSYEIILGGNGTIWIYNGQGNLREGWPQQAFHQDNQNGKPPLLTTPLAYDLNENGTLEILCVGKTFQEEAHQMIWGWTSNGQELQLDYLTRGGVKPEGGLLLADLNNDGWLEGVVFNAFFQQPYVHVFTLEARGFKPWPQVGGTPSLQFVYDDDDFDKLSFQEECTLGTDPTHPDSDRDTLSDWEEVIHYRTDPMDSDGDNDTLSDGAELELYRTDPFDPDTDKDGLSDGAEVYVHDTDPNKIDSDGDGLSDGDEVLQYGTDPTDLDTDDDGLLNADELTQYGTDPTDSDSDNDGLSDGEEINQYFTDPLNADSDGDGVTDGMEVFLGLNPLDPEDIFLISLGLIGLALVTVFLTGFQIFRVQKQKWLKQGWKKLLLDQHIAPINIAEKAATAHLSPDRCKSWLEEFLEVGPPEGVMGLYNPEKQFFLSLKTLQLWLDTMNEIPLESLVSSLELSLDEIEQQLQRIVDIQGGEWVLTNDYLLRSRAGT